MSTLWMAAYVVLAVAVALEAIFIAAILKTVGSLHSRLAEPTQSLATPDLSSRLYFPDQELVGIHGDKFALSNLWLQGGLVVSFVSSTCSTCAETVEILSGALNQEQSRLDRLCILSLGSVSDARGLANSLPMSVPIVAVDDARQFRDLGISAVPTTIFVDITGRITEIMEGLLDNKSLADALANQRPPVATA